MASRLQPLCRPSTATSRLCIAACITAWITACIASCMAPWARPSGVPGARILCLWTLARGAALQCTPQRPLSLSRAHSLALSLGLPRPPSASLGLCLPLDLSFPLPVATGDRTGWHGAWCACRSLSRARPRDGRRGRPRRRRGRVLQLTQCRPAQMARSVQGSRRHPGGLLWLVPGWIAELAPSQMILILFDWTVQPVGAHGV